MLERHEREFFNIGIKTDYELVTLLSKLVTSDEIINLGRNIDAKNRVSNIYAININQNNQLKIIVAENGYIITAYPTSKSKYLHDEYRPYQWMHI